MKNTKPKRKPYIRVPDFRNVERGKRMLAEIIRDSEKRDKAKDTDDTRKN